ncbi:MAG: laccase domain-containing protein [Mailhella sp.]|nr:laccase domain-containing protein [Mailhella sp.]
MHVHPAARQCPCTFHLMHKQYFSHRQDNQTGRQASLIWFE